MALLNHGKQVHGAIPGPDKAACLYRFPPASPGPGKPQVMLLHLTATHPPCLGVVQPSSLLDSGCDAPKKTVA